MGIRGFSLVELLVAMTLTLGISAVAFQLFQQNSRVFRDQEAIMATQQAARAVVSEITDELRIAGQGVPIFNAADDAAIQADAVGVIMAGSSRSRIHIRSGRSNVEAVVTAPLPLTLTAGANVTVTVSDGAVFSNAVGSVPIGKFAFIQGRLSNGWGWARAALAGVSGRTNTIQLIPVEMGGNRSSIQFESAPLITLEEAVAIFRDDATRTLRRTTAVDMSNPALPGWAPANDMALHVSDFRVTYYARNGAAVEPDTPDHRASIAHIEFELAIETEVALSAGAIQTYRLSSRVTPANLKIR